MKIAHALSFVAVLGFLGCSSASPETVTSGSVSQVRREGGWPDTSVVLILVVDDAPTSEAAALRAGVAGALRATLNAELGQSQSYDRALVDPAAKHPVDLRVVVVHPSGADSTRAVGPSDDPRLAWVRDAASTSDIDALADAVTSTINDGIAMPGAPFLPLATAVRTLRLAAGDLPAADAREAALVSSLGGKRSYYGVLIATTRDDAGSEQDETLRAINERASIYAEASIVTSLAPVGEDCAVYAPDLATRVMAWASANEDGSVTSWPCAADVLAKRTLFPTTSFVDYGPDCFSRPIARLPTGADACVLTWSRVGVVPCDASRGWLDPLDHDGVRRPRQVVGDDGSIISVCEIRALDGDAALACRTTLACDGCGTGWCHTEVPELADPYCSDQHLAPGLRFVGGSSPWGAGELGVTCELAD